MAISENDIVERLKDCNSKEKCLELVKLIGSSNSSQDILYQEVKERDAIYNNRASWAFGHLIERKPKILLNYIDDIPNWIEKQNQSTTRNVLRCLQFIDTPKNNETFWIDYSFGNLLNFDTDIAVKVHSLSIAKRMTDKYPELQNELLQIISQLEENASTGLMARIRKIKKELKA